MSKKIGMAGAALLLGASVQAQTFLFASQIMDARNWKHYIPPTSESGNMYGYAPTSLYENGVHHLYFCSDGGPAMESEGQGSWSLEWDYIRYATSRNGKDFTPARIVLKPNIKTPAGDSEVWDKATCDPSVVKANGYYYLFYGGSINEKQGAIFLARASKPEGPFQKLMKRNGQYGWDFDPPDPHPIVALTSTPDMKAGAEGAPYGSGQPSVVFKDNTFHLWYYRQDNTGTAIYYINAPNSGPYWVANNWSVVHKPNTIVQTGALLAANSVEVRFNTTVNKFEMFYLRNWSRNGTAAYHCFSNSNSDPSKWGNPVKLTDVTNYSHNLGILDKSATGTITGDDYLLMYGGPQFGGVNDPQYGYVDGDAHGLKWGYWDLLGIAVNPKNRVVYSIPPQWQWSGMGTQNRLAIGDYDGDGLADRAIINQSTGAYYVIGSRYNAGGVPGISWEQVFPDYNPAQANIKQVVPGDYDGDGKTDMAFVDRAVNNKWWVFSSMTQTKGVTNLAWGESWAQVTSDLSFPVADYDGDGKTDAASYSHTTGRYCIKSSKTGYKTGVQGLSADYIFPGCSNNPNCAPAPGDYDGDRITDAAVVDYTTGKWYVWSSILQNQSSIWGWQWGGMGLHNQAVPGDYDGDGRTDLAIINKNNGHWYVISSRDNTLGTPDIPWEWPMPNYSSTFTPALGDFDGGGMSDRAFVDVANGRWYIVGSKTPTTTGIPVIDNFDY